MFRFVWLTCLVSSASLFAADPKKAVPATPTPQATAQKVEAFKPFTGKVNANKVRIRAKADLEGHIIRQVGKDDLLLITGEVGEFYAVEPPKGTKAYVFRPYILDQVVEAERVNVRLEPHVEAPIIGQLHAGERVEGKICEMNHKWLEIAPPKGSRFYVAKEFIAKVGGPEYLSVMEKRKGQAEELLASATFHAEEELKKGFEEMKPELAIGKLQTLLAEFSDFPPLCNKAKEELSRIKEAYLNKKIGYLEGKKELSTQAKEEMISQHRLENPPVPKATPTFNPSFNKGSSWEALEEGLYLSWSAFHTGKSVEDFYNEQKANSSLLVGVIEPYHHEVKNKPGNYLLRSADLHTPIAYLYSTQLDLGQHVGKKVTLLAHPRPNHHFAFPAYYVFSLE